MKKRLSIFLGLLMSLVYAFSQAQTPSPYLGTITVFAEEGENFTLFVNGEKKNETPAPKVLAENVTDVFVSIRIVFQDASIQPLKKSSMRGAKDCTYMLAKNKKGEYQVKVKSCTNPFPPSQGPAQVESIAPTAPAASGGPLSATYSDGTISVSNGSRYTVTKSKTSGGFPQPHVKMNAPVGAKVTITYDDNNEKYVTEVPFDYEVKDYNNNNSYFRLTVDEGGPEKTWYVRLQNGTAYVLTIE